MAFTEAEGAIHRAFQRSMILHFPEAHLASALNDSSPNAAVCAMLKPFGFASKPTIWLHEVDLNRGYVVVINGSTWSVDMAGMTMCNEDRRHVFEFPRGFFLPPRGRVKVSSSPCPQPPDF
jgi:hypothetical protein